MVVSKTMNNWEEVLDETKDACRCKADPPRCPNAGRMCFCPGYCQPNTNCPKHGYDMKDMVQT